MDTPAKQKNWFRRHKALTASILVVVLAVGLEAADQHASNDTQSNTSSTQSGTSGTSTTTAGNSATSSSSSSTTVTSGSSDGAATPAPAAAGATDKMTIAGSTATLAANGSATVTGRITNNQQNAAHGATIQATFYDSSNKVVGIAKGTVSSIDPDQYKPFTLTTTQNVSTYAKMVVEVINIT